MASPSTPRESEPAKARLRFPSSVTTLAIVMVLVWVAAPFIPAGRYAQDSDGSPIPGTFAQVGYEKYLQFMWPLILALFVVSAAVLVIAATIG